jgi:hypothetical protein
MIFFSIHIYLRYEKYLMKFRAIEQSCNVDCVGTGCRAIYDDGVCVLSANDSFTCQNVAKSYNINTLWFNGSICVAPDVIDSHGCNEVSELIKILQLI